MNTLNAKLIYGNSFEDIGISILIIISALLLNRIIIWINKNWIQKLTAKTKSRVDDILFKLLEGPILFGITLAAIWVSADRLEISKDLQKFVDISFKFLIVANVTWFVGRLTKALIEEYLLPKEELSEKHKKLDYHLVILIRKVAVGAIWAVGFIMALNNVGIDVRALIGTLGIGGLAFALAAQDTIKNIFGGLTIFTDRPFRLGDRIVMGNIDGFVEDIGIRSTRIRTLEKKLVAIPNSKLTDASIENVSEEPMRRVLENIGLTYHTTPDKMKEALEILKNLNKQITGITDITAYFSDFGDFSLNISFIYFIKKSKDIPETISQVNQKVHELFIESGLEFAFPTHTIRIEQKIASL